MTLNKLEELRFPNLIRGPKHLLIGEMKKWAGVSWAAQDAEMVDERKIPGIWNCTEIWDEFWRDVLNVNDGMMFE